ncbi:MAG: RES family NAD+ phosphorylase, partial [Acidobacteriota bacterium]|nr:RES family NAD+ phosphorylase [Acidobacteriota bacterium]
MIAVPPETPIMWPRTCRLVPSRYPTVGLFDRVAEPEDLPELFELEGWTNDRLSAELGLLHVIPGDEWVAGPMASVVMAAFCHPPAGGARFSDETRGAWYAGRTLETALAESTHRRTNELAEIGVEDTRVQMRLYHADFDAPFHDV